VVRRTRYRVRSVMIVNVGLLVMTVASCGGYDNPAAIGTGGSTATGGPTSNATWPAQKRHDLFGTAASGRKGSNA
jgi:hypothetical protein